MNPTIAKSALVGLTLVATWSTAEAQIYTEGATPQAIDNVRIFKESYVNGGASAVIPGTEYLTPSYGTISAGTFALGSDYELAPVQQQLHYGALVGTQGSSIVIGLYEFQPGSFAPIQFTDYLNTGSNFTTVYNAILNGTPGPLVTAFADQSTLNGSGTNGAQIPQIYQNGAHVNYFFASYARSATGVTQSSPFGSGYITGVLPVPEPTPFAALGAGALALLRRRRK